METQFITLEDGNTAVSLPHNMLKLKELLSLAQESFEAVALEHIQEKFSDDGRGDFTVDHPEFGRKAWMSRGIDGEILKPSSRGWQKGRVRFKISLEFQSENMGSHIQDSQNETDLNSLRTE